MRKFFTIIFFFGISSNLFSQKITGTVTDGQNKPLPYSSIFIKETGKGITANNDGKYSMKLLPGTYTIVFTMDAAKESYKVVVQ